MARDLIYDELVNLSLVGGYRNTVRLSNLTGVFLLSACWVLRDRNLWQTALLKISDSEYENIIEMIEQAEYELMTSHAIGEIVPTVSDQSTNQTLLLLDGTVVDGTQYPELLAVVPASWVSGTDIQLPDMSAKGLFGENSNVGSVIGQNDVTLSLSEIPEHTHIQNPHSHGYSIAVPAVALGGEIPATASIVTLSPATTAPTTATNQNAGGGGSHTNIQESLTVYWWIVAR